ncbi:ABC transporter ATP-binding protein [Bacillus sp. FJAT-27225]|uniref:ABC transporter ATP-binding protein n=1 Tax=Bacillus sp. FJAT-27225 TaxID=1743144 RepID=UPI00080C3161|nr:ABC transporter ATP-binding protein [Bacillus sp. FJAT-27225]OCA87960.1 ABC transporter ATP-binding protein [Bacillus sp. FJAT-27225]
MEPILQIEGLSISFGGLKAVDNLSFTVGQNQIYGLIGPNGAGKTTVFNCISGFYRPDTGKMTFQGSTNLLNYKVHQMIDIGLVRTFQNVELFKNLTVLENLIIGQHHQTKGGFLAQGFLLPNVRREEKRIREKALGIMDFLGIRGIEHQPGAAQPYGVMKLIELGRALMSDPKMIILDEPAAGMNHSETQVLTNLIKKIRDEFGITILLVEHDMNLVMEVCERICAINFGKKLAEGTPKEIQNDQAVQEAYLGKEDEVHA